MEIKDKKGKVRVTISNFQKIIGSELAFVSVLIKISMDNFSAIEPIEIELSDLIGLNKNLEILNKNLKQIFYFQHIDEQFQLKFEPLATGNIQVTGFLKDKQYLNSLNFTFEFPPTELSIFINELENIIDVLKE